MTRGIFETLSGGPISSTSLTFPRGHQHGGGSRFDPQKDAKNKDEISRHKERNYKGSKLYTLETKRIIYALEL